MSQVVDAEWFCRLARELPVIDVRSPLEYEKGHMAGAINVPLFSNDERAVVGITYANRGQDEAIKAGEEIAYRKTRVYDEMVRAKVTGNTFLMYCWRGGLRSAGMAKYYEEKGFEVILLKGGYKAYRKFVRQQLGAVRNLILIGGNTGTGKTEILRQISNAGFQAIDLEKLACHKGSAFGHLGENQQPTTEHFENILYHEWQKMDPSEPVWIEHESLNIGNVFLPETFYTVMKKSPLFVLQIPLEERIKRIVSDYSGYPPQLLREAIQHIRMRLGTLRTKLALEALHLGNFDEVAELLLVYYDKLYSNALDKWPKENIRFIQSGTGDAAINAGMLLDMSRKM